MRSGISFSDNYLHRPRDTPARPGVRLGTPGGPAVPSTLRELPVDVAQKSAHGGPFQYRSCETDVLGWICEVAGGQRMPELMSELLWSRIGAQCDAPSA